MGVCQISPDRVVTIPFPRRCISNHNHLSIGLGSYSSREAKILKEFSTGVPETK